jgi:hypothetical protein
MAERAEIQPQALYYLGRMGINAVSNTLLLWQHEQKCSLTLEIHFYNLSRTST